MKLISWNINGYRAITGQNASRRLDQVTQENKLFKFIEEVLPDIICFQETKSEESQIVESLRTYPNYYSFYSSAKKKGYSGVAVFTKKEPIRVNRNIGIDKFDDEGRMLELEFDDYILFNIYFPSGTSGMDRVEYKLEYYTELFNYIEEKRKSNKGIVVCGDFNTAHNEIDIARPKDNVKNSGFMPIEREKFSWVLSKGYIDCFRHLNQNPHEYSWWSQRGGAREKNIGWRIDYFLLSKEIESRLKKCYYLQKVMGSDHCPVVLEME